MYMLTNLSIKILNKHPRNLSEFIYKKSCDPRFIKERDINIKFVVCIPISSRWDTIIHMVHQFTFRCICITGITQCHIANICITQCHITNECIRKIFIR